MLFKFKDTYQVSNSLAVFNYYKKLTGRSLERDIANIDRVSKVLSNLDAHTEQEINDAYEVADPTEILQYIYYAMRCAGESKELALDKVIEEIDVADIIDGSLQELITKLVEVKKKTIINKGFLKKR